jgi:nitrite reductase/ring-hydroxylating ferredoxin subunit
MEEFVKICNTSVFRNKKGKKFIIDDDIEIAVFKVDENYYAVSNICPHNHSPVMSDGFIDQDLYVTCPVHCYKFQIKTGEVPIENKEMSGKLETFKIKIIDDELWVEKREKKIFFNW